MNSLLKARKALKAAGFTLKRRVAKHDIYCNDECKAIIPLKRHDFNDNDLKYILKEIRQKTSTANNDRSAQ